MTVIGAGDTAAGLGQPASSQVPASDDSAEELYQHAPCGYVSTALDGTIVRINDTLLNWLGYERDAVVGIRQLAGLMTPGARVMYLTHHVPQLERTGSLTGISLTLRRADNSLLPIFLSSAMTGQDGDANRVIRSTIFDATERAAYERELVAARDGAERSAKRLKFLHATAMACAHAVTAEDIASAVVTTAIEYSTARGCALWVLDETSHVLRRTAASGVSDALAEPILALESEEPPAVAWRRADLAIGRRTSKEMPPVLLLAMADEGIDKIVAVPLAFERNTLGVLAVYLRRTEPLSGDERAVLETLGAQVGQALERARLHKALERKALHDALTGLPNRSLLFDRLGIALARSHRTGDRLAVLAIDLNGFKAVNDRFGHAVGDDLLTTVAERLRATARSSDTVARLGGDEFVVLCEQVAEDDVEHITSRIREALEIDVLPSAPSGSESFGDDHGTTSPAHVSAAIGTILHSPGDDPVDPGELLAAADEAMYRNKRSR